MKNALLSGLFDQMADVMEILGEDRFRINSYRKVARVIGDIPTDVEDLLASGELAQIPGVGKSSLAKIEEFIKTGATKAHQELLSRIPPELPTLLAIPGVGPKGVKAVYEQLKVTNIAELKDAIENGSVAELPGFGEKKASAIARGIAFLEQLSGRIRLDQALEAAETVRGFLREVSGLARIQTAGSVRRRAETIGDVDILVGGKGGDSEEAGGRIIQAFTTADFVRDVLAAGPTKGSAIIQTQSVPVHVDVRVVPERSFGAAAQYFTGSKDHNVRLREIAVKAKLKLNEYGLFKGEKMIAGPQEEEIYHKLGLDYVEPVLREDRGEIKAAKNRALPDLIQLGDVRGDLHMHTNASDGASDVAELARAAKDMGHEYICITDHSKSSAIANGLSAKKLAQQIEQIRAINEKLNGITILAGSEVDILANGALDFDDELLAELDFVIASIHSGMGSPREKVTTRTLKAMDNPYVSCIAHPTGRLIGQREAMDIDMAAVIEHAARTHTALEVNANPWRLDLKDVHCKMAIEAGVGLFIGTDAHSPAGLGLMGFGVATAARGWAAKADVLNTLSAAKIISRLRHKRGK
ncbi:MAG: DNA polymerase/3'-5' exonuclease PolX [Phycisphaerales bacterium]|nr:MAG: DNA polymerase/3'-5' exonuclease PolX [Phycisphaerales bacterium]